MVCDVWKKGREDRGQRTSIYALGAQVGIVNGEIIRASGRFRGPESNQQKGNKGLEESLDSYLSHDQELG